MTLVKENLLVTVGASGSAVTSGILVEEASLSLSPEIESRRFLSNAPNWGHSAAPSNSISIRGPLSQNTANLFALATGEIAPLVFRISSGVFSGCYLEEVQIEGQTHSTIEYRAQFKFWDTPIGAFNSNFILTGTTGILNEIPFHSSHSTFASSGIVYPDQFSVKIQSERVPRFLVGSESPTVRLARCEKELVLKGKNVNQFIGISGGSGYASFNLTNASGIGSLSLSVSGKMTNQDFELGDLLVSRVSIKEFIR